MYFSLLLKKWRDHPSSSSKGYVSMYNNSFLLLGEGKIQCFLCFPSAAPTWQKGLGDGGGDVVVFRPANPLL